MGGAESVVRNTDKRTSRREHRASFQEAIGRFRAAPFDSPLQASTSSQAAGQRCVRVCVRKRPFFPHEEQQGEFDVVSCLSGRVVVHDARMRPDMRNMVMNHHDFAFDEVFGEEVDNDAVYAATAHELVLSAVDGFSGTIMCYGQTGSGKTFTMATIYEHMANDLFASVGDRVVTVCFIELLGDKCYDMLNGGTQCNLVTAADGSVHPYPCVEVPVTDATELRSLIDMAGKLRATAATGVHDQSSRSHACCRIFVASSGGAEPESEGTLTLVDLAGTEHRIDSAEHNVERQREGAKINASLASLKECIRATAAGAKFVPFRRNWLTQLLRGCFSGSEPHTTVIVATVSPSSKDTEHSLNTLRHACIMDGQGVAATAQSAHVSGGSVTKEALGEINVTKIARERTTRRKAGTEKPSDQWSRPPPGHQAKQSNTARRPALDRQCLQKLRPRLSRELLAVRAAGASERQRRRFARAPPGRPGEAEEAPGDERCPWPPEWKEAAEDARGNDVESLSPRCGREAPLPERAAAPEPQLPREPSPGAVEEEGQEEPPGAARPAWQGSSGPAADQGPSQSQESSTSAVAPAAAAGEPAGAAEPAEAAARRRADEASAPRPAEAAEAAAAAERSSASSSPREAPAAGGLPGGTNSAPWLLCAAVAQDALQGLAASRRPRGSAQQPTSSTGKSESRVHEAKTSVRASTNSGAAHASVSARQKIHTPRTSEVVQPRDSQRRLASQEDGGGPSNPEEYLQRRVDSVTAAGARGVRSGAVKSSFRTAKAASPSQGTVKPLRRSRDTTAVAKSVDTSQPGPPSAREGRDNGRGYDSSAFGAELGFGVGADDGCPPWPPDNVSKDEPNPPVVRSPTGNREKSPRILRSPRHSDGGGHACPTGPPALAADPAEGSDHEKAEALFRLFCSGGRNAREWRKNDLRLISTCVVPALFGERAKIDWAHPSAGLDELERLVVERPLPPDFCPHPSASSQPAPMQHRRSASSSGRGSPMVGSPGHVRHSRSPAIRSSRDGGSHTSRPSTGDARECAREVSPFPLSPLPRQSSQVSVGEDCSPPPRRAKSSCLLPLRTSSGIDEAAAREPAPAVPRQRSLRSSTDEEIADLEWKVANTELGVKQWLTELRAAVRQDACAVST